MQPMRRDRQGDGSGWPWGPVSLSAARTSVHNTGFIIAAGARPDSAAAILQVSPGTPSRGLGGVFGLPSDSPPKPGRAHSKPDGLTTPRDPERDAVRLYLAYRRQSACDSSSSALQGWVFCSVLRRSLIIVQASVRSLPQWGAEAPREHDLQPIITTYQPRLFQSHPLRLQNLAQITFSSDTSSTFLSTQSRAQT